jgi:hypothetical protein
MRAAATAVFLLTCIAALNAQDRSGTIVFYREPHFAGSNSKPPTIFCDGAELAHIGNGSYFEVTAPAGLHTCEANSSRGRTIEVNVLSGVVVYVHVEMLPGFSQRFGLANTTQNEYAKQKAKLKPVKEWSRNSLTPALPIQIVRAEGVPDDPHNSSAPVVQAKYSGRFGDLALRITKLVNVGKAPATGRHRLEILVSATNAGKAAICANLNVALTTTFGLQYSVSSAHSPDTNQMLPNESSQGVYTFDVKDGVDPEEIIFTLNSTGIRCIGTLSYLSPEGASALPRQIHVDIHDLPVTQNSR